MGCGSLLHVLGSAAVRFAIPLLVVMTAVALVAGCGDGDDEAAAPVPLAQRFVTAEDAPGSKPDPVETRQTTMDFDEFTASLSDGLIDANPDEMNEVFENAGFTSAGLDARFFG